MSNFKVATAMLAVSLIAAQPKAASIPTASLTQSAESMLAGIDWPLDLDQIKNKIHSFTAEGEEPIGAKAFISQHLLPKEVDTARELQAQADQAEQSVSGCKQFLWSGEKEAAHRQQILGKDESARFNCIAQEHILHKEEKDSCGDLQFISDVVVKTKPKPFTSLKNKTVDEIEAMLRESQEFYSEFYPKMANKHSACGAAEAAAENQHEQCDADKEVIEAFYCTMKFGRDKSCEEYDACYAEKTADFDKIIADVKGLEVHTKKRFQTLTCYAKEGSDESSKCNKNIVNVAQLTISYPLKPQKESCIRLMKTRRSYTSVVCKAGSVVPHGDHPGGSNTTSNTTLLAK